VKRERSPARPPHSCAKMDRRAHPRALTRRPSQEASWNACLPSPRGPHPFKVNSPKSPPTEVSAQRPAWDSSSPGYDPAVDLNRSPRFLDAPSGWVLYLSHSLPIRLVVFVHGFAGAALNTWQYFPETDREWWSSADLLFVGYDSRRDNITGTAARLRRELPRFYPYIRDELAEIDGVRVRPSATGEYRELVLVGHSLGGVILRRALCDVAQEWQNQSETQPDSPRPRLLDARLCLFSPASAGFRPAGLLGLTRASPFWLAANLQLRRASAFTDLQPGSQILVETRARTQRLVNLHRDELSALRAGILWANPDNVVITERYDTDFADDAIDNTTHRSVCKPHREYEAPWVMVEAAESQ
jgi:alpha-beta hydrolase superfamily lysophospholipase